MLVDVTFFKAHPFSRPPWKLLSIQQVLLVLTFRPLMISASFKSNRNENQFYIAPPPLLTYKRKT